MEETNKILIAQNESIIKKLDILQDTIDRRFQESSDDRKDISEILVLAKTLVALIEGTRDDIHLQTKKVVNRVDEHLMPVPEMMGKAVKHELNKKSMIDKIKDAING